MLLRPPRGFHTPCHNAPIISSFIASRLASTMGVSLRDVLAAVVLPGSNCSTCIDRYVHRGFGAHVVLPCCKPVRCAPLPCLHLQVHALHPPVLHTQYSAANTPVVCKTRRPSRKSRTSLCLSAAHLHTFMYCGLMSTAAVQSLMVAAWSPILSKAAARLHRYTERSGAAGSAASKASPYNCCGIEA